jgi:hypothetical protein
MGVRTGRRAVARVMGVTAAALLSGLPPLSAHAQQQNLITLSCNGTSKLTATAAADVKPEPITNMGIIVNVADRTVTFMDYVTPITSITATLVGFTGQQAPVALGIKVKPFTIDGSIDRVTGHAEIGWWYEVVGNNSFWELTCRPATRLF